MSTNRIGIIIQGTLSGLTNLVVSPNMAILLESPVVKPSLLDERNEIAQFARNTNVYSLENNAHLNIFSIILTDKLDAFKRAGYVAIRLYFPNGVVCQQPIVEILNQLKEKYEEIAKNNTGNFEMYANQFLEIVAAIQTTNGTPSTNLGMQKKACFGFDVNTENVSQKIQTLTAASYFSKIYGVPVNLLGNLTQNGYIDISHVTFHKVTINGMFQLVQNVTVNNQSIVFDKNNFSLELKVLGSDQILINYKDGRTEQVPPQKVFHSITQQQHQQQRPQVHQHPKQVGSMNKNNLLFIGGLVVVLSLALYIFWPKGEEIIIKNSSSNKKTKSEVIIIDTFSQDKKKYIINGDVLEYIVDKTFKKNYIWENADSTGQNNVLKFSVYKKTFGVLRPDKVIITTDLPDVYRNFNLDPNEIKTIMDSLISRNNNSENQTNSKQNNSPSNTKIQSPTPTIPVKSKSPVAGKTKTETKEADNF